MSNLTPALVEDKLRELVNQLTKAEMHLSTARDLETDMEIQLKRARLTAEADGDCPKPVRGGVTVAEREAWVDRQTIEQWATWKQAVTQREIASDRLRTTRDIASVVQTLAKSVQQAYSISGTHG